MRIAFDSQVTTALSISNLKPYITNNEFNAKPAFYIHPSVQILELSSLHFSLTECSLLQGKHLLFFLAWRHRNPIYRETICFRLCQNKYILYGVVQSQVCMERGNLLCLELYLFITHGNVKYKQFSNHYW